MYTTMPTFKLLVMDVKGKLLLIGFHGRSNDFLSSGCPNSHSILLANVAEKAAIQNNECDRHRTFHVS